MPKVALALSLFCASATTASFLGWLVALSPLFSQLSFWMAFVLITVMIVLVAFDDGLRDLLGTNADNAYYGAIAGGFLSILIGTMLVWICR